MIMIPQSENIKYYVYGVWIDSKQIILNNNKPDIREFDDIDKALEYMKSMVLSNINISWSIVSDSSYIENQ